MKGACYDVQLNSEQNTADDVPTYQWGGVFPFTTQTVKRQASGHPCRHNCNANKG